jgi:hypothetical protein
MTAQFVKTLDGRLRVLGLVPSQIHCPSLLATIPQIGGQIIPESALVEYEEWPICLPVLNQGQWNACTYFASTQALLYGRYQSGQGYVVLDPMWPYLKVTNGQNVGTNLIESCLMLSQFGVPPVSTPPHVVIQEAARFRFEISEQFTTYLQLLSAVARRRAVVGSVCVGDPWMHLDGEGVPGIVHGQANHAIFLGGGVRKSPRHGWMIRHVGSWGTHWGYAGFGWFTEAHFNASKLGEAYAVQGVHEDLADGEEPPAVLIA